MSETIVSGYLTCTLRQNIGRRASHVTVMHLTVTWRCMTSVMLVQAGCHKAADAQDL